MARRCCPRFPPGFDYRSTGPTSEGTKTGLRSKDFLRGQTLKLSNGSELEFVDILSRHPGLIGRGTMVIQGQIKTNPDPNQIFAVKVSSPAISRRNERDLLELAYAEATGDFEHMREHLPKLLHWEDIDFGDDSSRRMLASFYDNHEYERRAFRVIMFLELWPIQRLSTDGLSKAFRDIFKCYRWLYEKVGIIHRDISLDNMMYYIEDKQVRGVLNDFDLATVASDSSPSSKQRTGARAYMANELLRTRNIRHLYRHDLESFFYVILILTSHFENEEEVDNPPYKTWFSQDPTGPDLLPSLKVLFLTTTDALIEHPPTPPYRPFLRWLEPLQVMFRAGAMTFDKNLDNETLGGQITFDKMAGILEMELVQTKDDPFLSPE